jgi:hypothetical protein
MKILSICHVIVYFVDQSIIELVYAKCKLFKIDINAFLCMAVWIENWNVLLETKAAVDAIKFTLNNDKSRTNRSDVKTSSCSSSSSCGSGDEF